MILIDADKLIQEMRKWYWDKEKQKAAENDVSPMDLFTHLAITTVQEQPTAFDADKVVEQLEEVEKIMTSPVTKDCFGEECRASDCTVCLISKAIEIVKGGGVE